MSDLESFAFGGVIIVGFTWIIFYLMGQDK